MNDINIDEILLDFEQTKLNKIKNDIYLSNNQLSILKRYNIDCYRFNNLSSLIFEIEMLLNNGYGDTDLEQLSIDLSQINYYNNTNK